MQPVREVYSLLMPVQNGRLIVPRAAVAEVTGFSRPKERPASAPDFLLGFIDWQGQRIPLVSFEAARGQGVPELGRRTRVAIVFGIGGRLTPDVFAIVTQGYPYLVRVNENVLRPEPMAQDDPLVLAQVRMANEKPFIPDLEQLETMIAEGLGLAPAAERAAPADELDAFAIGEEDDGGLIGGVMTADDAADDVLDIGSVTAFGAETDYSAELGALDEVLESVDEEGAAADDAAPAAVDLDDVASFGTQTNYSVEFDELSEALQDNEGGADAGEPSIDLSILETDSDESGKKDGGEFDLSDLEIDFGDDDKS